MNEEDASMTANESDVDDRTYKVVINDEEQYSIWFADRDQPAGWRPVGHEGSKSQCLEYINEVWTDMRPRSLRQQMDEAR
jgi:MbtH protein